MTTAPVCRHRRSSPTDGAGAQYRPSLGHRRVGLVVGELEHVPAAQKTAAFRQAKVEHLGQL